MRQSGKNSADIRMVVDALDLCYTKAHVDTFVIISGDSDFSPLVSKLRENNKIVIGVGVKNSTSDLLIANCDEFIFYDDLVREQKKAAPRRAPAKAAPAPRGKRRCQGGGATAAAAARAGPRRRSRRIRPRMKLPHRHRRRATQPEQRQQEAVDLIVEHRRGAGRRTRRRREDLGLDGQAGAEARASPGSTSRTTASGRSTACWRKPSGAAASRSSATRSPAATSCGSPARRSDLPGLNRAGAPPLRGLKAAARPGGGASRIAGSPPDQRRGVRCTHCGRPRWPGCSTRARRRCSPAEVRGAARRRPARECGARRRRSSCRTPATSTPGPIAASGLRPARGRRARRSAASCCSGPAHRVAVRGLALPAAARLRHAARRASTSTPTRSDARAGAAAGARQRRRARAGALARGAAAVPAGGARRTSRSSRSPSATRQRRRGGRGARPAVGRPRDADRRQLRPVALPPLRRRAARSIAAPPSASWRSTPALDHEQACGATPLNGLLVCARAAAGCVPELLDLRNSGDTAGDRARVVGYAAFAFRSPAREQRRRHRGVPRHERP